MSELEIKIHHAIIRPTLKGRVTKPAVGIQDSAFVYVPAIKTNLAERFRNVLAGIGERRTVKA
jgi:ABC-type enterobactin transport system permease subunit